MKKRDTRSNVKYSNVFTFVYSSYIWLFRWILKTGIRLRCILICAMQGTWQISSCSPWNFASNCLLILDLTCLKFMKMKTRKYHKRTRYLNISSCLRMLPKHNRREIYFTYMSFTNVDCQQQDVIGFQCYLDNVIFRFILFFVDKSFL